MDLVKWIILYHQQMISVYKNHRQQTPRQLSWRTAILHKNVPANEFNDMATWWCKYLFIIHQFDMANINWASCHSTRKRQVRFVKINYFTPIFTFHENHLRESTNNELNMIFENKQCWVPVFISHECIIQFAKQC